MEKLSERMAWAIEECVNAWSELEEEAIKEGIGRLAYYEDLEEQGRLVVLPHPVGQVVWVVRSQTSNGKNLYIREERIDRYIVAKEGVFMCFESGRTSMSNWQWEDVYISREAALKALRG